MTMEDTRGQPVLMSTPGQSSTRAYCCAVNDHTGETLGLFCRRKRLREGAARLQAMVDTQPTGTISVAWDHAAPLLMRRWKP
jgi:hypothetical protein